MTPPRPDEEDVLAQAVIEAVMEARWITAELVSRRPMGLAPDLLRGRATELAASPAAHDQILSLALDAAAQDLDRGLTPLWDGAMFMHRPDLAPLQKPRLPAPEAGEQPETGQAASEAAERLEARHRAEAVDPLELSGRMATEGRLQAILWSDPRIPADAATRVAMRGAAALLAARAEALHTQGDESRREAARALRRPPIVLSEPERERLRALAVSNLMENPRLAAPLLEEVERAAVLPESRMPAHVARLGAEVEFTETLSGRTERRRLVLGQAPEGPGELPILSSVGTALIGLCEGQSILWRDHLGLEQHLTVRRVWPPRGEDRAAPD